MGWFTLNKANDEAQQLQYAISELYTGVTVLESHRQVYTPDEKLLYQIDYDAVSYHAARINATNEIQALIILERTNGNTHEYKPYTENACPGEADCPKSILDKLTPTQNELAIEWRGRAQENLITIPQNITYNRIDPDSNPLYSRDGNDFTDALIEHFEDYKPIKNNQSNTTMEKTTVSGFVGKNFNYNYNEETKKSVISLTIKPKDGDWVQIKAFNQNADLIKNAIENEEVKKLTITGKMKEGKPYTNKKGDLVEYQELVADTVNRHKTVEVNGVIAKVDEKKTSNDKPYTHLFIKNNVAVGGVEKVEQFNITIFQENKKGIPKDVELKVGQPIAIKGEATINRYLDKENKVKESTNINAWNVDRTPTRLKEQIENLQKNSAKKAESQKEAPKKAAKKSTSKGKGTGMEM